MNLKKKGKRRKETVHPTEFMKFIKITLHAQMNPVDAKANSDETQKKNWTNEQTNDNICLI